MMTTSAPIFVTEQNGIPRVHEPVTVGLPFPKGWVRDPSQLQLIDTDRGHVPLQATALTRWSDNSVKWGLVDFQANVAPHTTKLYQAVISSSRDAEDGATQADVVHVAESAEGYRIDTGAAEFFLDRTTFYPLRNVYIRGREHIDSDRSGWNLRDGNGLDYKPIVAHVQVETAGPLRTTFRIDGRFANSHGTSMCEFDAWLSFFAGSATVRLEITIRNSKRAAHADNLWDLGDAGSVYIKDLSLRIALRHSERRRLTWSTEITHPFQAAHDGDLEIYQDSSGGANWGSRVHVNREGKVSHVFCGYRAVNCENTVTGRRAQPIVAVCDASGGLAASLSAFWQNFPKALEVHGSSLIVRLFPQQYADIHELQGGEQKTHTLYLDFMTDKDGPEILAWTRAPLTPHSSPEWYAHTEAIPYLVPKSQDRNVDYLHLVDAALEGDDSFAAKREFIDEYGWRHFGDLYADHEGVYCDGSHPVVSHYNNQYDAIHGALIQFLRSADTRWFDMAHDLATHVVDIDIYHTTTDKAAYNNGLFWHTNHYVSAHTSTHRSYSRLAGRPGGGPSNEHCYTTGLLFHYLLTGNSRSREAVLALAKWMIHRDDGSKTILRWLDRHPTGAASATGSRSFHGPGRGAGNAVNALLDAFTLTHDPIFARKADQLIRRCIHPRDDIEKRRLLDAEQRWSYTVFLQILGKYLDLKIERGHLDSMYAYARASLLHYAGWMAGNEIPYLTTPEKLEYPTETWSAQDMRKSDAFKFAAKHAPLSSRDRFVEMSEYFFRSSLKELLSSQTRTLTRPLVLMMTHGYMHTYFQHHPGHSAPGIDRVSDFSAPEHFIPQRIHALRKLGLLAGALISGGLLTAVRFLPF